LFIFIHNHALVEVDIIANGKTKPEPALRNKAEITIKEGKYHQVKRMFAAVGHPVKELERVAFGPIKLGELPPGQYRHLTEEELKALKRAVKLDI